MGKSIKSEKRKWLDLESLTARVKRELTDEIIADECMTEILKEKDQLKALSKVIFTLIYLVQDDANGSVSNYIDFLLSEFEPLAKQFDKKDQFHFFDRENGTMLRFNNGKRSQLLMRSEFFAARIKEVEKRLEEMK